MKRLVLFLKWVFSFFPEAKNPKSPVIVVPSKKVKRGRAPELNGRILKDGFKWNPVAKYPRNEACFCGSGVKAKKCCVQAFPLAVEEDIAAKAAPLIKKIRKSTRSTK